MEALSLRLVTKHPVYYGPVSILPKILYIVGEGVVEGLIHNGWAEKRIVGQDETKVEANGRY